MMLRILIALFPLVAFAQLGGGFEEGSLDDDLSVGNDIFTDFSDDIDNAQVLEDERFYRYGRFFQFNVGGGLTTFTGNRGRAQDDENPSFQVSVAFFTSFQIAYTIGIEYSRHQMVIDNPTVGSQNTEFGAVDITMLRPFFGLRYYIDTSNLSTAITYANPYFVGRIEYWYQTNKFVDREADIGDDSGGGLGMGAGIGLEFPITLKETYLGVELLYHEVAFFDRDTQAYRTIPADRQREGAEPSVIGYENLRGAVLSVMFTYNMTW